MPVSTHRPGWRRGEHLVVDERTGEVIYASEAVMEPDTGLIVHKGNVDPRHPLLKVRPKYRDPKPVSPIIPAPNLALNDADRMLGGRIGSTNIPIPGTVGPAQHLFSRGIGEMCIEGANEFTRFKVR